MFKKIMSALLILISIQATAQKMYTISGTVSDQSNGETLINAVISVQGKNTGATTNEYGFYSISLPAGNYTIVFNYIGFNAHSETVTLDKDVKINVKMTSGSQLKEVTVTSKARNDNVTSAQMGVEHLDVKKIESLPVLFGEKDVVKIVQLLPGIKSAGDGNSGFFVRGGGADQNLILLDEAIVYNPSHLLGFFSVFNSDAIKNLDMYKGNQPAQYGGRLSSVMDIKMNDGNDQSYHASGGIGLISSRLNIEGPIVKDEGSFWVSARRTYADAFLALSNNPSFHNNQLYFYDLNAKLNYKLSDNDRLYLSGYYGQDVLGFQNTFGINWGNATATLRWNHIFSPKLFSNTSAIYSNYKYNIYVNTSGINGNLISSIQDWNIKESFSYYISPTNSLNFGLNSIFHTISPGIFSGTITAPSSARTYSWENAIFVDDKWKVSERLNVDAGVRLSSFSVLGGANKYYDLDANHNIIDTLHYPPGEIIKTYVIPEPRLSLSYQLNESSSFKAAYARNAQYLHLLSNSTTSNPTDKWVATNNIIQPETANQFSVGYFKNFKNDIYQFSVESYYKNMQNEVDYKDNAQIYGINPVEPELLFGNGRAYGLELMLKKTEGRFSGWVAYTLSRTELKIDGINNDNWYPAKQDRTHDISIVGMYKASDKWTLSADYVYYTGNAVTFPSGKYNVDNQVVFYYTQRNGYRMPAYSRLDLGATVKLKQHKHYSSELTFSLYNALGRENPYTITFQTDPNDPNKTQALQTSLFRWVPSISYNFKF